MKVLWTGTARIQHKQSGAIYEIKSNQLEWDEEGMGEGSMGAESQHKATVEHPELGPLVWTLGEYPVGVEDYRETDVGKHKLLENFDFHLQHEEEAPEDS